jgi:3-oxoacyl-(acyl-carrier-protein) synthase
VTIREHLAPLAITGLGVVSPFGLGTETFWAGATSGKIAIRKVTRFDASGFMSDRAAEPAVPRSSRYTALAVGLALTDAGLVARPGDTSIGICAGTVYGTRPAGDRDRRAAGGGWLDPLALVKPAVHRYGLDGPARVIPTTCTAGNHAIGMAADLVRSGRADAVVAVGVEELSAAAFAVFTSLRTLAPDVARPFDRERRGVVLAEGAGALVLEPLPRAKARGAAVYGLLLGYAATADAHHLSAPHPDGTGLRRAIDLTLQRSGVSPSQVDYVSAHGTGTAANDPVEAAALLSVFGRRPAVSSLKGMMGHTGGAAGAMGAIACLLSLRDGIVPGNPTLDEPDPACRELDLVRGAARRAPVRYALNNAIGFGGGVATTLFGLAS